MVSLRNIYDCERSELAARLEPFCRMISVDFDKKLALVLHGSWANAEYHAVRKENIIHSYSDVDLTSHCGLSVFQRTTMERSLHEMAELCGLKFRGVSVRLRAEMSNMWEFRGLEHCDTGRSEFVQFWALIGAAEVCVALLLCADEGSRQYHLNKFFLGMWRDIAIIFGQQIRSYKDTLDFAAHWLPGNICTASYALKLGFAMHTPWSIVQNIHQVALSAQIREFVQSDDVRESIWHIMDELIHIEPISVKSSGESMLWRAKDLEHNLSARMAARRRLLHKLKVAAA